MNSHKEQLLKLKAEYEQRLNATEKHLYRKEEPVSADFEEQAVELENEEVVEQLDNEAQHELSLVNKALAKIENETYGLCEACDAPISEARLDALPQAPTCINCAS